MAIVVFGCLGVLAATLPEVMAHGGVVKPLPRVAMGRTYEPWSIGEHQPKTNPYGKSHLNAQLSSPCMGSPMDGRRYHAGVLHDKKSWAGQGEASYPAGGTMDATIYLNADHQGLASWSYCPHSMEQTEDCFRSHEMLSENHGQEPAIWVDVNSYWGNDRKLNYPWHSGDFFPTKVYLPANMPTGRTTIRWLWICSLTDEIFVSCLDTEITAGDGGSSGDDPKPAPEPATPAPNPVPSGPAGPSECIWTDPPNVEWKRTEQRRENDPKRCWHYELKPGTTLYIRSNSDIYTSWNADVCCVSASPTYGSAPDSEPNVVAFTQRHGNFGFCECLAWNPASPGGSCAGQAQTDRMKCPVNGGWNGVMCPAGDKGSEKDNVPIACGDPYVRPEPEPEPEPEPVPSNENENEDKCSAANTDRYGPDLGGCCAGLQQVTEDRPSSDPFYCASSSLEHLKSCWSTIEMCRPTSPSEPEPAPEPEPEPAPGASSGEPSCRNPDCGCPDAQGQFPDATVDWCSQGGTSYGEWCSKSEANCNICQAVWCPGASLAQVQPTAAKIKKHNSFRGTSALGLIEVSKSLSRHFGEDEDIEAEEGGSVSPQEEL